MARPLSLNTHRGTFVQEACPSMYLLMVERVLRNGLLSHSLPSATPLGRNFIPELCSSSFLSHAHEELARYVAVRINPFLTVRTWL